MSRPFCWSMQCDCFWSYLGAMSGFLRTASRHCLPCVAAATNPVPSPRARQDADILAQPFLSEFVDVVIRQDCGHRRSCCTITCHSGFCHQGRTASVGLILTGIGLQTWLVVDPGATGFLGWQVAVVNFDVPGWLGYEERAHAQGRRSSPARVAVAESGMDSASPAAWDVVSVLSPVGLCSCSSSR